MGIFRRPTRDFDAAKPDRRFPKRRQLVGDADRFKWSWLEQFHARLADFGGWAADGFVFHDGQRFGGEFFKQFSRRDEFFVVVWRRLDFDGAKSNS